MKPKRKQHKVGERFGRMTLVAYSKNDGKWECFCDCGNKTLVYIQNLVRGYTKSCGCYNHSDAWKKEYLSGRKHLKKMIGALNPFWSGGKGVFTCEICSIEKKVDKCEVKKSRFCSRKCKAEWMKKNYRGELSPHWRGGVTPLRHLVRSCAVYNEWRKEILERDNYTCGECNKRGGELHVDHIKPFSVILNENFVSSFEEAMKCLELWDTTNGRVLCKECHKATDTFAGRVMKYQYVK
jgi:5-methylcytosine-specific restriction endonuclease McrA